MLRWSLITVRVNISTLNSLCHVRSNVQEHRECLIKNVHCPKRAAWTKPATAAKCKMKYVCGVCKVVKRDLEMEEQKGEREANRKTQRKTGGGGKKRIQSSHKKRLQKPPETVASHPVHTHTHTNTSSRPRQPVEHLTAPTPGCYYSIWERELYT